MWGGLARASGSRLGFGRPAMWALLENSNAGMPEKIVSPASLVLPLVLSGFEEMFGAKYLISHN
jgi:hypothetical protein